MSEQSPDSGGPDKRVEPAGATETPVTRGARPLRHVPAEARQAPARAVDGVNLEGWAAARCSR